MKDMLGERYQDFIACYDKAPVKSLRLNTRKISFVDYAHKGRIFTQSENPEPVHFVPGAYYYEEDGPGKSPYHEAGAYYIQEASAMLPVTLLDISSSDVAESSENGGFTGLKVLDLCAAPGGKSTQIADLMQGAGLLVSNEIVPSRASILSENIERMGVENALVISADPKDLADRFPCFFDRILVDAPCSGEGMFRRNPEAVSEWSPENVAMCADRQDMILDCAAAMLATGGKIVYSTCTFSPEEDEGSVERFLSRHPEFAVCDEPQRLYPHTFRGEGHFAVSFKRIEKARGLSDPSPGGIPHFVRDIWSPVAHQKYAILDSFINETFNPEGKFYEKLKRSADRLLEFGDSLYLAPEYMPDIRGLKVYRAGIKLGTFKKMRFEPDHALSHVLSVDDVKYYVNLSADSDEVRQYLSGMTLNCDRDIKGWCLVCVDDLPLGWGKASAGVLKNHYPKGLRKN
jgi:16S rRNA C967 or C1407 C5-methylase (RsmB/RsmF family)/NOL1/NOP2/fmu family ribosome biogenesis protein